MRALYDYEAADVDEISIKEGDTFDLIQEREFQPGLLDFWQTGLNRLAIIVSTSRNNNPGFNFRDSVMNIWLDYF